MPSLVCPHCETLVNFELRQNWESTLSGGQQERWGVWTCGNEACRRPIVGEWNANHPPARFWPVKALAPSFRSVPSPIEQDATEAHMCFSIGALRATAAMARRAIQGSAIDKGATTKKTLYDQIDELADKEVITKQVRDVAHKVRVFGNSGAHPGDDGLETVTPEEAQAALTFLGHFLTYVYTIPAELEAVEQQVP